MHFYRKCWFDLFKEQFISLLNFGQNYFVQLRWNWFSVRLPLTNAWNCHLLYTAFSSNGGAWGMWACSLFLSYAPNDVWVLLDCPFKVLIFIACSISSELQPLMYCTQIHFNICTSLIQMTFFHYKKTDNFRLYFPVLYGHISAL